MYAKGAQWHGFGVLAVVTLATSTLVSPVPILCVLQDQVLLLAWPCKDIPEDQVAILPKLPRLDGLKQGVRRRP